MLPDRIGRPDDPKAHQEQNLREAETIQTALGEAFDEGIGADRAIHREHVLNIQPLVYAFIDLPLYDECAVNRCLIGWFDARKAGQKVATHSRRVGCWPEGQANSEVTDPPMN